jgi:hypothetical protein
MRGFVYTCQFCDLREMSILYQSFLFECSTMLNDLRYLFKTALIILTKEIFYFIIE